MCTDHRHLLPPAALARPDTVSFTVEKCWLYVVGEVLPELEGVTCQGLTDNTHCKLLPASKICICCQWDMDLVGFYALKSVVTLNKLLHKTWQPRYTSAMDRYTCTHVPLKYKMCYLGHQQQLTHTSKVSESAQWLFSSMEAELCDLWCTVFGSQSVTV